MKIFNYSEAKYKFLPKSKAKNKDHYLVYFGRFGDPDDRYYRTIYFLNDQQIINWALQRFEEFRIFLNKTKLPTQDAFFSKWEGKTRLPENTFKAICFLFGDSNKEEVKSWIIGYDEFLQKDISNLRVDERRKAYGNWLDYSDKKSRDMAKRIGEALDLSDKKELMSQT